MKKNHPTISGYQLNEHLYENDRVSVFRGIRQTDNIDVVLKILKGNPPSLSEIETLKEKAGYYKQRHPSGAVSGYQVIVQNKTWFVEVEDFGGESLLRLMNKGTTNMNITRFLRFSLRLTEILGALNKQELVHGIINPTHILWNMSANVVKLTGYIHDWVDRKKTKKTYTIFHRITDLAYGSPEQMKESIHPVDYRTDFYSTGLVLFELLTGRFPFPTSKAIEIVHHHIAQMPQAPHEIDSSIPVPISGIIMKLIAKNPESRYQSAFGIKSDLEKCIKLLETQNNITDFEIGSNDHSGKFTIPSKIYGRQQEIQRLQSNLIRTGEKTNQVVLIAGKAGIGKTALVLELKKQILNQGGLFTYGKFDQSGDSIPYKGLIQAFRGMIQTILTLEKEEVLLWKTKIKQGIGRNGQVIVNIIPEIELIIGKQPDIQNLPPYESQNRFHIVFQEFVQVFMAGDHPYIIFIDDLQWADLSTFNLLERLLMDPNSENLFLIGAYRNEEIDSNHPLKQTIDKFKKSRIELNEIILQPLERAGVKQLFEEMIPSDHRNLVKLTDLCIKKTNGNPFFLLQFITTLIDEKLIQFDQDDNLWQWDTEAIDKRQITDNVADLIVLKTKRLGKNSPKILHLASCIGHQFDSKSLTAISGELEQKVVQILDQALDFNLIVRSERVEGADINGSKNSEYYQFAHDRIWHLIYHNTGLIERNETHRLIGHFLMGRSKIIEHEDLLFQIANHFNLGLRETDHSEFRQLIATLNLRAGLKARSSAAYDSAIGFFISGLSALKEASWKRQYELMRDLHLEWAHAEFLCGEQNRSMELIQLIISKVDDPLDQVKAYSMMVAQFTMMGRFPEAIKKGKLALGLLGVDLPESNIPEAICLEQAQIDQKLKTLSIPDIIKLPLMIDAEIKAVLGLLMNMAAPVLYTDSDLFTFITLKKVNLSLQFGNCPESCAGYFGFALMLGSVMGRYQEGYLFGTVSLELADQFADLGLKCKASNAVGSFVSSWVTHIRHSIDIHQAGYQAGKEAGDLLFAGYNLFNQMYNKFIQGVSLNEVLKLIPACALFSQKSNNAIVIEFLPGLEENIAPLISSADQRGFIGNAEFDEVSYLENCLKTNLMAPVFHYLIDRTRLLYLFGYASQALEKIQAADQYKMSSFGYIAQMEFNFFYSLSALACYSQKSDKSLLTQVRENQEQMKRWADSCEDNFLHKYFLVEAELVRVTKNDYDAIDLYEQAIHSAKAQGFIQNAAIAAEAFGWFWIGKGKDTIALLYLKNAYEWFQQWGAQGKLRQMERAYPGLNNMLTPNSQSILQEIDYTTLSKANHTLANEIVLSQLIEKMLRIVRENAGAEKCLLILREGDNWYIRDEKGKLNIEITEPIAGSVVPLSIVHIVITTAKEVNLENAGLSDQFAHDSCISKKALKSVLCMPLINRGRVLGLIYLENNLLVGAFNRDRIEILSALSSQMAISIENAAVYDQARKLSRRILTAREDERKNLARELHDGVGQSLLGIKLNLQMLQSKLQSESRSGTVNLTETIVELSSSIDEIRNISMGLRPPLEEMDIDTVLIWTAKKLEKRSDIKIDIEAEKVKNLNSLIRDNLFRIFQEALSNVIKHSNATRVQVRLQNQHQKLLLEIHDNGQGFDVEKQQDLHQGIGLDSMRERVELFKGNFSILSNPDAGTTIKIYAPFL
jgi:predicted ATPase/signal transduction histidine kinase